MPLTTNTINEDEAYYTDSFKTLIRSHYDFLKNQQSVKVTEPDRALIYAHRYDFYGYLNAKDVPPRLWWVCAYLTGIDKPHQDISVLKEWYRPNDDYIDQILARNNTIRS